MKKLFTIAVFLMVWSSYSQTPTKTRNLYINNQSSFGMDIGEIKSKPTSGTYPFYISKYTVNGVLTNIHLNPGQSLNLVSPYASTVVARFPFYSPTSVPYINLWNKTASATSSSLLTSSTMNTALIANAQIFDYMKFQVGTNGDNLGNTIYRPTSITDVQVFYGTGWVAYCSFTGDGTIDASIDISIYDN